MTEDDIYADFRRAGIVWETHEHPPVMTVDDSAAIHDALDAAHTKNLFLKDKQKRYWLVVLPADRRADLKAMAEMLGAGKFSFASADDMERLLGITPGAVTPLAIVNAPDDTVSLVLDAGFRGSERIAIHPLRNTATIALSFDALIAWLEGHNCPTRIVALP